MEHKQIFSGSVPPLSPEHSWCVAQNSETQEDDETQVHIFYNLNHPMSYYRCQIPELLGKSIRGCFHGCWAVLSSNHPRDVMWSLWNPFTSQIISLPPLILKRLEEDSDDITYCCLTAPPDHPNSLLLLTRSKTPNIVYCRIGRDSYFRNNARERMKFRWAEKTFSKELRSVPGSFYHLTCCNSKVYAYFGGSDATSHSLLLVEFDIVVNVNDRRKYKKLKEVVITLSPVLEFHCPIIVDSFSVPLLKGSCSELLMIVLGFTDETWTSTSVSGVYVFKLDMNNMRWEELEDLQDTTLSVELATESSTFYSPATASSEFGGYIHILANEGKIIYSYNVKDKSISLSCIPCLAGTNHVSAWAMLERTRLESNVVYVDCKQEKEAGMEEDGILLRSVKGNQQVESHLVSFPFRGLNMEFSVKLVENNNRLESENADSIHEGDKNVSIIVKPINGDEVESHLLNLPLHVLGMVMEFSVGVEYLKFRSACKTCHLAAPLIPFNNGKASKRLQKYSLPTPWLISFDKHKGIITFTDPMFGDKYFIRTPQELICDFEIKGSRYGWLLILKDSGSLVFYNPFTSDIRELPQLRDSDIFSFSAPPTSPDCMVVGIAIIDRYNYHLCIHFVGGEPSWRRIHLDIHGDDFFSSLTVFGRDLYALRDDRGLDVFEEIGREDQYSWKPNVGKAPTSCCTSLAQSFLLRCDQHLLQVIVEKFGESVEVFKFDDLSQEWVKLDSLGKHVIFIWGRSSLCIDAKKPLMENKIFFPRMRAENENMNDMLFYSLETCRYHTCSNKNIQESFGDFFGTKHLLTPHAWIEPTWS